MIKSIKFGGESIEELEIWYYAPKHEYSAAEFARECGRAIGRASKFRNGRRERLGLAGVLV